VMIKLMKGGFQIFNMVKKTAKRYVKEDEALQMKEAEDTEEAEEESEEEAEESTQKRKTRRVGGKLIKEDESEDEAEDESEDEEESEDRMQKEDEAEDEDEEEEELTDEEKSAAIDDYKRKKKEARKGDQGGLNPGEAAQSSSTEGHTTTSKPVINTRQNVFNPKTNVSSARNASDGKAQMGQSPSDISYTGKSVNPDLMKSPLFQELDRNINGIRTVMSKKIDSVEKSMNDRLDNLTKVMEKLEKFYNYPFYKSQDVSNSVSEKSLKDKADYSF